MKSFALGVAGKEEAALNKGQNLRATHARHEGTKMHLKNRRKKVTVTVKEQRSLPESNQKEKKRRPLVGFAGSSLLQGVERDRKGHEMTTFEVSPGEPKDRASGTRCLKGKKS